MGLAEPWQSRSTLSHARLLLKSCRSAPPAAGGGDRRRASRWGWAGACARLQRRGAGTGRGQQGHGGGRHGSCDRGCISWCMHRGDCHAWSPTPQRWQCCHISAAAAIRIPCTKKAPCMQCIPCEGVHEWLTQTLVAAGPWAPSYAYCPGNALQYFEAVHAYMPASAPLPRTWALQQHPARPVLGLALCPALRPLLVLLYDLVHRLLPGCRPPAQLLPGTPDLDRSALLVPHAHPLLR